MKTNNDSDKTELVEKVTRAAKRNGLDQYLYATPLVVGVSGGADSLALLHVLRALRGVDAPTSLHVAHLDHGLRGEGGAEDARFVAELAEGWGLKATVRRFDVGQYAREQRLSIEEAARQVRYGFLAALAAERDAAVAVAHNADDQAETVLMRILRGSGTSGLRGMKMLSHVPITPGSEVLFGGSGTRPMALFRPMLGVWRLEIEEYCAQVGLRPRTDPTNTDRRYTRNRIRHELLPLLERDYSPAIKEHLYTLAELAAGEDDLLETLVEEEARRLANIEDAGVVSFKQEEIGSLPAALRLRLARWAIERVSGTLEGFTHRQITEAAGILAGEAGLPRAAHLPHGLVAQQAGERSIIAQKSRIALPLSEDAYRWPLMVPDGEVPLKLTKPNSELKLEHGWTLRISVLDSESERGAPGKMVALFDIDALNALGPLTLRTWRQGDVIRPMGMKGSKRLHDLFIDARIPKRIRNRVPVVSCSQQEILWVPGPGGRRSAHAPITADTRRVLRLEFGR